MERSSTYTVNKYNQFFCNNHLIKNLKPSETESAQIISKILNKYYIEEDDRYISDDTLFNLFNDKLFYDFEDKCYQLIIKLLLLIYKRSIDQYVEHIDLKTLIDALNDYDLDIIEDVERFHHILDESEYIPPTIRKYMMYSELIENYRLNGKIKIYRIANYIADFSLVVFMIDPDEIRKFKKTINQKVSSY